MKIRQQKKGGVAERYRKNDESIDSQRDKTK